MEYYADIAFRESPIEDVVGTHRLTADEARVRNHYRLAKDLSGRLISLRHALGDTTREPEPGHRFFNQAAETEICYVGNREVRHFRDAHGNPVTIRGSVAEERYELDENGFRRSLQMIGIDGEAVDNAWGIHRYQWEPQHDGSVIETRFNLAGEPVAMRPELPFFRLRLQFGPGGWLALMSNIDAHGKLVQNTMNAAQDRLDYRWNGELLAWNVFDAQQQRIEGNQPGVARGVQSYDERGLPSVTRYEDRNGKPMKASWGSLQDRADYDRFGNLVAIRFTDSAGNPQVVPEIGCAMYAMRWDASGLRRTHLSCLDADGNPAKFAQGGYHQVVERYDEAGDPVEIRFEDDQGRLVSRTDSGIARIQVRFDSRHRPVHRQFLDHRGKPKRLEAAGAAVLEYHYRADGYRLKVVRRS